MALNQLIWTGDPCVAVYPSGYWIPGGRRSGTAIEAEMTIQGTNLTLKLPIRIATTVGEVKEVLSKKLGRPPDSIDFVIKRGCTYAKLYESDQMPKKVSVRGIKSWERERHVHEHPFVIIGAGHSGLRQALACIDHKIDDFVVVDRWHQIGGDAWLKQANATSKLQTEFGTYHLQFNDVYPFPKGMPTYPSRDQMLTHLEEMSEQLGIKPHIRLSTHVVLMDKPTRLGLMQMDRSYSLSVRQLKYHSSLQPEDVDSKIAEYVGRSKLGATATPELEKLVASAVLMYPGALTLPKKEEIKGEEAFSGPIGYGMCDYFDYGQVTGKSVAVMGMGAFSIENVRTCLEHGASETFLICRRKNLVMPRAMSWFINQSYTPPSASEVIHAMERPYAMAGEDPWSFYGVSASGDRTKVRVTQRARFPISDLFFLAVHYRRCEVIVGSLKRLARELLCLEDGGRLEAECLIKALGFTGSPSVDKLLHIDDMLGYWVNGDSRRWCWSESPGIDFARIGGTSLSPGIIMYADVVLHYLLFPKDFDELCRSGVVPRMKPDGLTKYLIGARQATAIGMGLSFTTVITRDYNAIKRERQIGCHPLEQFVAELKAEWTDYCDMLHPEGSKEPFPEYFYTVEDISSWMEANDQAML